MYMLYNNCEKGCILYTVRHGKNNFSEFKHGIKGASNVRMRYNLVVVLKDSISLKIMISRHSWP